jgi:hypothetical protein
MAAIVVAVVVPAVWSHLESRRRELHSTAFYNLKMIAISLHNYAQATKGPLPPAYTTDKHGKPLLSWRVLILPYLEQDELYRQFHLDEPWDSQHNKKLIAAMPDYYRDPGGRLVAEGKTHYLAVRGKNTVFPGKEPVRFSDITDGTGSTIMLVEVSDPRAVIWTKPDDFQYDENNPLKGLAGRWSGGFHAAIADARTVFLPDSIDPKTLNAFFTRNGGETIELWRYGL